METPADETLPESEDEFKEADADTEGPVTLDTQDADAPSAADQTLTEDESDARESDVQEPESRSNWPLFALIAALFAALIFYLAKLFKTEKDEDRSEEHTSKLQSRGHLVCRLLLEKKKNTRSDDGDTAANN